MADLELAAGTVREVEEEQTVERAFLAIDLAPSRLAVGIVDESGGIILRDRVVTPARNVWPALKQLVGRVLAAYPGFVQPTWCGVTCPGPIDHSTGILKPLALPAWNGFPIRQELQEITGLPVAVETAGRGLALAELWVGVDRSDDFATLVLGDDVDGALVAGGRLAQGTTGNLGQFGHLIVEPEGIECWCGATGCLTMYAGARGIEVGTGREIRRTPPAIVERTGIMVARACASIAALLDVNEIIIGGIVPIALGAPFFEALDVELDHRRGPGHVTNLRVVEVESGRIGPLVTAAAVARDAEP